MTFGLHHLQKIWQGGTERQRISETKLQTHIIKKRRGYIPGGPPMLPLTSFKKVDSKSRHQRPTDLDSRNMKGKQLQTFPGFQVLTHQCKRLTFSNWSFHLLELISCWALREDSIHCHLNNHKEYSTYKAFDFLINISENDVPSYFKTLQKLHNWHGL